MDARERARGVLIRMPSDSFIGSKALVEAIATALEAARREAATEILAELRGAWSFTDGQRHTHSWHDREDFIERMRKRYGVDKKEEIRALLAADSPTKGGGNGE